jgi:hypothetical protein
MSNKKILLPTLVTDKQNGVVSLLPPRYEDPVLVEQFNSSPYFFDWGEKNIYGRRWISEGTTEEWARGIVWDQWGQVP